ncbi:MAG TPA: outer membrane protein assembly factor BamD [Opitutaceae bacterium]|nr:outer membrane protein assembly factor BamD [Opitutaceae bacterium]
MSTMSARVLGALGLLLTFFLFGSVARADLVWSPQSGWRVEGGVLSGLLGEDGRKATDLMNKARTAEEAGNYGRAAKSYERVGKRYGNSVYAPEAFYRAARMRLQRKQYYKAHENFQQVVGRYPNYTRFNEIIGEQYRIASAMLDGARNRIWGIIPGFANREKAVEYFEILLLTAPYSDYAPLALMNIARAHQKLGNDEEAIDALDRMINTYPQSLLTPDAYLKLAQTHASLVEGPYYDQGSTREAVTYFEDFMILFPSDGGVSSAEKGLGDMKRVLAESKMRIGDFYFYKRSNYTAARVFYNEAITVFPDSTVATKAREQLAKVDVAAAKAAEAGKKPRKKFFFF